MNRSEWVANQALANTPQYNADMDRWVKANKRADQIRRQAKAEKAAKKGGWFKW